MHGAWGLGDPAAAFVGGGSALASTVTLLSRSDSDASDLLSCSFHYLDPQLAVVQGPAVQLVCSDHFGPGPGPGPGSGSEEAQAHGCP